MIVAWHDPGLLTGVCIYDLNCDELKVLDEFDFMNTGLMLEKEMKFWRLVQREIAVGWETYTIMKGPQTQAPWSLEVIGELKYLCGKYDYTVLEPADPKARKVCTRRMLVDMGWYPYIEGKKDAFSSAQHMVAWMLRENKLPDKYKDAIYGPLR